MDISAAALGPRSRNPEDMAVLSIGARDWRQALLASCDAYTTSFEPTVRKVLSAGSHLGFNYYVGNFNVTFEEPEHACEVLRHRLWALPVQYCNN